MKKIKTLACFLLILIFVLPISASVTDNAQLLIDDADLLSQNEESLLLSVLHSIRDESSLDFVILTVDSLGGKSATEYADDYYDYGGYSDDGVLLLISMEERDWAVSTKGYGMTVFTDWGIDNIMDSILDDLSSGFYYAAFYDFLYISKDYVKVAENGSPYDIDNLPKESFPVFNYIIASLVIGLVVAFTVTSIMKGQLKSVGFVDNAASYIKSGSFELTESRDLFLYSTISKTPRSQNTSGRGGSKGHFSSSGSRHGGRSGKF